MVKKYIFGTPFDTEAVILRIEESKDSIPYFVTQSADGLCFSMQLSKEDAVYGLGEASRGINKRGYIYDSYCSDDPNHTEVTRSLYGAHNFIVVDGKKRFGAFFDCPSRMTFDIGFTSRDTLSISSQCRDMNVYIIDGDSVYDIVSNFRRCIGTSYLAPLWAFGYIQSRWSYKTADEVREVVKKHRDNGVPLDGVSLDIDYMERYKDFTINHEAFPDFADFCSEMKNEGIRLVPIIDAGVKIEDGYDVYEQGVENGYFCTDEDGKPYEVGVWPGLTHFPDFLNPDVREWFGLLYKRLTELGIEGFWNDMNEPAIFYSKKGIDAVYAKMRKYSQGEPDIDKFYELRDMFSRISNSQDDYNSFYHNTPSGKVRHNDVHNLYGYNMTRSAAEGLSKIEPEKRHLLFSRASYIGMHRYSGIWTGDNHSWWSHLLSELKMLPGLNMCGFLYVGSDIGGFGCDCSRDLILRWLSLGIFTPLMRNHSALGTRRQEFYQFEDTADFKNIIELRYRLIPYLYSEYMKAAINGDMYFKPLAFEYPEDETARHIEDQLMLGNELMIAPVYTQNAVGRYVYLPEKMTSIRLCASGELVQLQYAKGHHYIEIAENEVVFFIRTGRAVPLADPAKCTKEIDYSTLRLFGSGNSYMLYNDGGDGFDTDLSAHLTEIKK